MRPFPSVVWGNYPRQDLIGSILLHIVNEAHSFVHKEGGAFLLINGHWGPSSTCALVGDRRLAQGSPSWPYLTPTWPSSIQAKPCNSFQTLVPDRVAWALEGRREETRAAVSWALAVWPAWASLLSARQAGSLCSDNCCMPVTLDKSPRLVGLLCSVRSDLMNLVSGTLEKTHSRHKPGLGLGH